MNDISPIGRSQQLARIQAQRAAQAQQTTPTPQRGQDQIEISETAKLLAQLASGGDVRTEKVTEVKGQIDAGTYQETEEKIDAAVDGVIEDLSLTE